MSLESIVNEYESMMSKLKSNLMSIIEEETRSLFEKYPDMKLGYGSYIPMWNDGDTCEYTRQYMREYIPVNSWDDLDYDDEQIFMHEDYDSSDFHRTPPDVEKFCETFNGIPEEVLRTVFGDNVLVVITKDGITVDEYDCGY